MGAPAQAKRAARRRNRPFERPTSPTVCPHRHVRLCPLYIESHNARGLGCARDIGGPCAVQIWEIDYGEAVARLVETDAELVLRAYVRETLETGLKDGEAGRAALRRYLAKSGELPPSG